MSTAHKIVVDHAYVDSCKYRAKKLSNARIEGEAGLRAAMELRAIQTRLYRQTATAWYTMEYS